MNFWFIISLVICTAIVNGITAIFVPPLAKRLYERRKEKMKIQKIDLPISNSETSQWWYTTVWGTSRCVSYEKISQISERLGQNCFIIADIAVMAVVGILIGLLGVPCICVPLSLKGLPGTAAFVCIGLGVYGLTSGGLIGLLF